TLSVEQLGAEARKYLAAARQRPELGNLFTSFDPNYPQVKADLDRDKARKLGVPINDVFQAMSAALGSTYVNDFNRFGRLYRVYVQAEADYRRRPQDIGEIYVRSQTTGTMIPLSTLILAIVFVFLLLAAMYESWRLPWAVLLGSPLVALGAFFGVWLMGYDNNVYVQIGLIMLIGLAAKNAILIVEFAKAKYEEGSTIEQAALESARLRFRPILMTAFAFILGVVPLMRASGAGSGAQNVMGTAVYWGMLVATFLGVFIIPGNFAFVEQLGLSRQ